MRTWTRKRIEQVCGVCGRAIYIGQPLLEFAIAGLTRKPVRCLDCAGEPVPADLPPLEVRPAARVELRPALVPLATVAADFKQRQWRDA